MISEGLKGANRRFVIAGMLASLLPNTGYAGGEGGNEARKKSPTEYQAKPPKLKKIYTQREFVRLSQRELDWLEIYQPKIDGFSGKMAKKLVRVAKDARRKVFRLLRDMGKLKSKEKRVARLNKELKKAEKAKAALRKSLERTGEKKLGRGATQETIDRHTQAYYYVEFIKQWLRTPSEGQ